MATFSKRTLRILGDVLTDWSTLTPIGHLFEDNGIGLPPPEVADEAVQGVNGQRRGLTAQYVAPLDSVIAPPPSPAAWVSGKTLTEAADSVGGLQIAAGPRPLPSRRGPCPQPRAAARHGEPQERGMANEAGSPHRRSRRARGFAT
jgi:hypothetical protein